jgi:hypothetical protein
LQALEEVPDLLAPKPGQQQQQSLPQYPHPALSTLFAAKAQPAGPAPAATSSNDARALGLAASGSSASRSAATASASDDAGMPRVGSAGSLGAGMYANKHIASALQQQRPVRASDPTDGMVARSELLGGRSPSPRTAASIEGTLPVPAGSGRGDRESQPAAASSPPAAGGAPRVRTADEIRQAYGRPALSKAQVGGACFWMGWGGAWRFCHFVSQCVYKALRHRED